MIDNFVERLHCKSKILYWLRSWCVDRKNIERNEFSNEVIDNFVERLYCKSKIFYWLRSYLPQIVFEGSLSLAYFERRWSYEISSSKKCCKLLNIDAPYLPLAYIPVQAIHTICPKYPCLLRSNRFIPRHFEVPTYEKYKSKWSHVIQSVKSCEHLAWFTLPKLLLILFQSAHQYRQAMPTKFAALFVKIKSF